MDKKKLEMERVVSSTTDGLKNNDNSFSVSAASCFIYLFYFSFRVGDCYRFVLALSFCVLVAGGGGIYFGRVVFAVSRSVQQGATEWREDLKFLQQAKSVAKQN